MKMAAISSTRRSLGICLAIIVSLAATLTHGYDTRCPQGLPFTVRRLHERCFQFVEHEKYWDEARDYCIWYGGKLVKVDNAQTSNFLKATYRSLRWHNNGVWIGLHDRVYEMTWQWVTKTAGRHEKVTWTDWGNGHPGGFFSNHRDCVRMYRKDWWRWHEAPCHFLGYKYRFVCEYDALRTTTTSTTTQSTTTLLPLKMQHNGADSRQLLREQSVAMTTTTEPTPTTTSASPTTVTTDVSNALKAHADLGIAASHLARSGQGKQASNPVVVPSVAACGVLGLLVIILLFLLMRRQRKKKLSNLDELSFGNAVYVQANIEQPCSARVDPLTPDADDGACSVEISGLKPKERAQNHYVVQDFDREGDEAEHLIDPEASSDSNTDLNAGGDTVDMATRPLPVPDELAYEVPVQRMSGHYLPMNGSSANLLASETTTDRSEYLAHEPAGCDGNTEEPSPFQYDTPKPTNIYAEIPCDETECGNIYEALDSVRETVERQYANSYI